MQSIPASRTTDRTQAQVEWLLAAVTFAGALGILGWLLWYGRYGFDFTDEGFYLNWMRRPFNYAASTTQFGFVYHPLYLLVGKSIVGLRQANIALTAALGLVAGWQLLTRVAGMDGTRPFVRLAIAAACSVAGLISLMFAGMWLPTPSYNTLVFHGLLVTMIGVFSVAGEGGEQSVIGWIAIGIGGWLTFMGKPTSAAALAIVVALYVALAGKWRPLPPLVGAATAAALLLISAFLIDGSVTGFIHRLSEGARIGTLLDGGKNHSNLLRFDELILDRKTWIDMSIASATAALSLVVIWTGTLLQRRAIADLLACAVIVCGVARIFRFAMPAGPEPELYKALLLSALCAGLALVALLWGAVTQKVPAWRHFVLVVVLVVMPYAFAFGTTNNYWLLMATGGIFCVYAGVLLVSAMLPQEEAARVLLLEGLAIQCVVFMLLSGGLSTPYRQPNPLHQNDASVEIAGMQAKLVLARSSADYLASAERIAKAHGFVAGTPMLDLSGRTPGLVYALGGNAVGLPWTLGGYPGTAAFVAQSFRQVPCAEFERVWLLTEPGSISKVPPEAAASIGVDMDRDFEAIGSFQTPYGGTQYLLRPRRSAEAARAACEAARKETTT